VPGLPAIGGMVRAGKMLGEGADAARAVERGIEAAKAAENAEDFSKFFRWMDRVENIGENQRIGLSLQRQVIDKLGLVREHGILRLDRIGNMKTYRIADAFTRSGDIVEIKHVKNMRVTGQTRDLIEYARCTSSKLTFYVERGYTSEESFNRFANYLSRYDFAEIRWFP